MESTLVKSKRYLNCQGHLLDLNTPIAMGILNVTPDSFYDGGQYLVKENMLQQIHKIITEGAKIIDVGAFSSRPGAAMISEKEELMRLIPALELINSHYPDAIISVDTFRSGIAKKVVQEFNVSIINDISAGQLDSKMFETIAFLQVPYIMMHMQGAPKNMQQFSTYDDLFKDIFRYFYEKVDKLKEFGVHDIIIDPGFGFSKTLDQNYELLSRLEEFKIFELPLLVGLSRKSMIYKYLDQSANKAMNGTSVLNTIAVQKGANILRVHDIKNAVELIKLVSKLK